MPPLPLPRTSRWAAVALALAAASALALSVQAGGWWRVGELGIGPRGASGCFGGECRARGLSWLGGDDLWLRTAVATYAGALVAAALLVGLAGAVAAGRRPRLAARTSLVAAATAAVAGGAFWARFPGLEGVHAGAGAALFPAGLLLGLVAALVVLRAARRA